MNIYAHFHEVNGGQGAEILRDVSSKFVREYLAHQRREYLAGKIAGAYVLVEGGRNGDREYTIDSDGITLM